MPTQTQSRRTRESRSREERNYRHQRRAAEQLFGRQRAKEASRFQRRSPREMENDQQPPEETVNRARGWTSSVSEWRDSDDMLKDAVTFIAFAHFLYLVYTFCKIVRELVCA